MAEAPRFAYPFRLTARGAATVEQDSIDDLVSTAYFAIRTPPGWRPEAPSFGVTDPTFELDPAPQITAELERSDPRLSLATSEERDALALRIRIAITGDPE